MNKDRKRVDIREEYFVSLPAECRASVTREGEEGGEAGEGAEREMVQSCWNLPQEGRGELHPWFLKKRRSGANELVYAEVQEASGYGRRGQDDRTGLIPHDIEKDQRAPLTRFQRLNNPGFKPSESDSKLASPSPPPAAAALEGVPKTPTRRKFSMAAVGNDEYEPVRVPRPEGVPEWGAAGGGEEAPLKGSRKEDRWV